MEASLTELVCRLERATEANQDLALYEVRAALVPKIPENADWIWRFFELMDARAYTDAALALVERKLPGWRISIDQMKNGWDADLSEPGNRSGVFSSTAPTPTLAVCLALVRALATNPQSEKEPTNG